MLPDLRGKASVNDDIGEEIIRGIGNDRGACGNRKETVGAKDAGNLDSE
jgi:hypothetical protein